MVKGSGSRFGLRIFTCLMVLILLMTGCGGQQPSAKTDQKAAETQKPSVFIRATVSIAISKPFNPLLRLANPRAALWVFNRLVAYNDKLEPVSELAERWETSKDGLTYTFYLRKNVKWHDGKPFTADDVVFTAEAALDPNNSSPMGQYWVVQGKPVKVDKVDDYTVKMTLPTTSALFLFNMSGWNMIMPKHLLSGVKLTDARDFNSKPVGTGPYKVVELVENQHIKMEANKDYFLGAPKIDQWIDKQYGDQNAAIAALANGEIDSLGLGGKDQLATVGKIPGVITYKYDAGFLLSVTFKKERSFFSDVKVRRAMAYALDREAIVKAIAVDMPVAWTMFGPPSSWAYNPNVPKYPKDLAKAKALLAEAGFTKGSDGILTKGGKPFTFSLMYQFPAADCETEAFALVLQQAWKEIGINTKLERMDRATLEDRMYNKRDFDAYMWWDGYNFEPKPPTYSWGSGPDLITGFSSPEVDALLHKILDNPDQQVRKDAIWKLADMAADQVWMIPIYFNMGCFAMRDYVKGVPKPSAADFNNSAVLYEVHKLYIEKGK